ncbi:MAG: outer membrane PBP1 activator LpoA protein [Halioglobus sp.]|jgi:outer membrane PBP1 activator LpoA protein
MREISQIKGRSPGVEKVRLRQSSIKALVYCVLFSALLACGSAPQKKAEEQSAQPTQEQTPNEQKTAALQLPLSAFSTQFNNAERALANFDWMKASLDLADISQNELSADDEIYLAYLQARIAFIRGDQSWALQRLKQLQDTTGDTALRYRILSFKRHILELRGDYVESAELANQLLPLTPADGAASLKRELWRNLQRSNLSQLQSSLTDATQQSWLGWLELAIITRENPLALSGEVALWRENYPQHLADNPLPGGLAQSMEPAPNVTAIALILPLSGRLAPAGKAVLDGYLAAYYSARAAGTAPYELHIFDQGNYASANEAYDEAVALRASLVIGPLSKSGVADLAVRLERPVPVLALNHIDQVLPASGAALVQLALNPADEAARIAELAFGQGTRSALIVRPDDEWGSKVEHALRTRWVLLGGSVVNSTHYTVLENYTAQLQNSLGLTGSEQRGQNVRDMLAENIEFTPRRRQDPDVVFLLSRNGSQARSLKPLLAFLYAGDLPVYALSSIYNGVPDDRNRDLNGIHLVETPWLLGAKPGLRVAIAAADSGSGNYTRLNALGADAFLLQSDFNRLSSGPDALLRGSTGLLSMDPDLRIQRELSPATFDGGDLTTQ